MSYPLRLPGHLDDAARERAAAIGISFNAFICVCVEAYLQQQQQSRPSGGRRAGPRPTAGKPSDPPGVKPPAGFEDYFDAEGYAECFGPDAVPDSPEDLDALVGELEAKQRRLNARNPKRRG